MAVFITVQRGTFDITGIQYTPSEVVPLPVDGTLHISVPAKLMETLFTRPEIDYRWNPSLSKVEEIVNLGRLTMLLAMGT